MSRLIDHLVYCVPNLDQAIIYLEDMLGVRATIGGNHTTQGTKNALINLGQGIYLEILAVDEYNTDIQAPRWMGIDLLQSSKITRWALKTQDILQDSKALHAYQSDMGNVTGGSRKLNNGKTLTWQITMPLTTPEVDIAPFITDWSKSNAHPTDTLDHPCTLLALQLNHPNPNEVQNLFDQLDISLHVNISHSISIQAIIESPNGVVTI